MISNPNKNVNDDARTIFILQLLYSVINILDIQRNIIGNHNHSHLIGGNPNTNIFTRYLSLIHQTNEKYRGCWSIEDRAKYLEARYTAFYCYAYALYIAHKNNIGKTNDSEYTFATYIAERIVDVANSSFTIPGVPLT